MKTNLQFLSLLLIIISTSSSTAYSQIFVTSLNDAGANTLRQAIIDANNNPGADIIDITVTGTIRLQTALPVVTTEVTVQGPGADMLTISGDSDNNSSPDVGIFTVRGGNGNLTLNDVTLNKGRAEEYPGFSNFRAGGGIMADAANGLTVNRSAITECVANKIDNDDQYLSGGGVYIYNTSTTITGCLIANNSIGTPSCTNCRGGGAGMDISNFNLPGQTVNITNTTFSGNRMDTDAQITFDGGAAVRIDQGNNPSSCYPGCFGDLTVNFLNCTIANNTSLTDVPNGYSGGNPGYLSANGNQQVTWKNCLFANNRFDSGTLKNMLQQSINPLEFNNTSNGGNISDDGSDISGGGGGFLNSTNDSRNNGSLNLSGSLANNGGPTQTLALSNGSSAINNAVAAAPTEDQRGYGRNGNADSGAFEFNGTAPSSCNVSISSATPTPTSCGQNNGSIVVSASETGCTGSLEYSIGSGFQAGSTFNGLAASTYTVTVRCSNDHSCSANTTVVVGATPDTQNPTANCPANITVGNDAGLCGANVTFNATVSDNCPSATIACSAMSGDFFAVGTTTVNCVAVDAAGNTATCSFDITVNDTQKPTANCPVNISTNVDPGQCTATVNYGAASAVDNCPGPTFSCSPVSGSSFNVGVTTVTCTATDAAGNTANCTFNVTVIDNQGPTANCPGNQTVNVASGTCAANVSWTASASDNCPGPSVSCSPASGSSFGVGVTPVTCTATDASGNTANCTFNVTVIDNQGPTAICHGDTTVVNDAGLCGATVSFSIPDPTDNCPGATSSANPASGSFFAVGTNPVTVTATDAAGNTGICSFNVTVNDTQKPTANCPANITVGTDPGQCNAVVIYSSSASDNCPGATVICAPASGSSFGVGTTTVTCTATDASGNTGGCTFTVTVNDNEDPTPNCNTTSVNLDMAPGTHTFSQAEIDAMGAGSTDNCGSVTFSANPTSVSCADGSSATVALTVDDGNGNSSMCNATVNINDPNSFCCQFTATCPMNTGLGTFDCSTLGSIPALPVDQAGAAAPPYNITFGANPCGTILVSASDDASPNVCGGTVQNITRTVFTWDDLPGGTPGVFDAGTEDSHTCTYTYTVNPDGAPSAVCPSIPDVELDANGNGSLPANIGGGLSTDDCGTPTETSPQQLYTCADIGPQTVTLTATDACNNMDTENCSFNVVDNTDPVITCPANVTKECDQSTSSTWTGTATATDNCSASPTISESDATAPGSCANEWTITRTWTADDGNGNTATCDQTINVVDSQGPAITCPAAVTVECDADHSPASTGSATALDNCDTQPAIASSDAASAGTCAQEWTITRTWTATDACGNPNSCDQVITVEDTTAPTISCPPDVTVECGADNTSASTGTATATDNCSAVGGINISESDAVVGACANTSVITRTWTATDECGNPSSCGQTVTVEDSQGPTVSCPANTTVECNEDNTSANTGTATATDNCSAVGGITIGESDATTPGSCANEWTVTRTWTATDECGQSSSCDQTINVEDSTGPAMSCGALTVTPSSGGTYTLSQTEIDGLGAGSTDNCGSVTFTAAPSSFNCADEGANSVTVTGTDECGNSSSCTATVTVTAYLTVNSCTATDESCTGAGDGTITVSATALGGQVKYSIDGGVNFSASGSFTNLTPATYNIVVKVFGIAEICEKTDTKAVAAGGTAQVWHKDADGDGYSDGNTVTSCTQPTGYIASPLAGTDCNDADPAINPGATETCDGLDNDCDGTIPADETDADGDGYMVCENDCDDSDPDVNPGATETCNGIDDDCDGDIDEGVSSGETFTGNVTLASQADVDAWQACYSKIDGNLTISGYNISNLGPLINIEEVTGSVSIFYNGTPLTSLDGLDNLATVGGSLSIFYNFSLSDCCALYNLINGGVTGTISIFFNATGCNSTSEINSNCNPSPLVQNPNGITSEAFNTGKQPSIVLFPNPTDSEVTVQMGRIATHAKLKVFDLLGRVVYSQELEEGTNQLKIDLNTSVFKNGIYLVSLQEGKTVLTKQLVIQK